MKKYTYISGGIVGLAIIATFGVSDSIWRQRTDDKNLPQSRPPNLSLEITHHADSINSPKRPPAVSNLLINTPLQKDDRSSLSAAIKEARHQIISLTEEEQKLPDNTGISHFAYNPGQNLTVRFGEDKVTIGNPVDESWSVTFRSAVWRGNAHSTLKAPSSLHRTMTYQSLEIDEWFINGDDGVEQGWTVRSAGPSPQLSLDIPIDGLTAVPSEQPGTLLLENDLGQPILSYHKLVAYDANDRTLPSSMNTSKGDISIHVDTSDAVYPITIDPLITSLETSLTPEVAGVSPITTGFGASIQEFGPNDVVVGDSYAKAAYYFQRHLDQWQLVQRLVPGTPSGRTWASTMAKDGNTLAICGIRNCTIFEKDSKTGLFTQSSAFPLRIRSDVPNLVFDFEKKILALVGISTRSRQDLLFYHYHEGEWSKVASYPFTSPTSSRRRAISIHREESRVYFGIPGHPRSNPLGEVHTYNYEDPLSPAFTGKLTDPEFLGAESMTFGTSVSITKDHLFVSDPGNALEPSDIRRIFRYQLPDLTLDHTFENALTPLVSALTHEEEILADETGLRIVGSQTKAVGTQRGIYFFDGVTNEPRFTPFPEEVQDQVVHIGKLIYLSSGNTRSNDSIVNHVQILSSDGGSSTSMVSVSRGPREAKFGQQISLSGNRMAISAPRMPNPTENSAGRIFVYATQGTGWYLEGQIRARNYDEASYFGSALALDKTTLIFRSSKTSDNSYIGSAEYIDGNWTRASELRIPQENNRIRLGTQLALLEGLALVTDISSSPTSEGLVYLFRKGETDWNLEHTFRDDPTLPISLRAGFGYQALFSGDQVIISSTQGYELSGRRVSIFHQNKDQSWSETQRLDGIGPDIAASDSLLAIKNHQYPKISVLCYQRNGIEFELATNITDQVANFANYNLKSQILAVADDRLAVLSTDDEGFFVGLYRPLIAGFSDKAESIRRITNGSNDRYNATSIAMDGNLLAIEEETPETGHFGESLHKAGEVRLYRLSLGNPLQAWKAKYFQTISESGDAANLADPNRDGVSNIMAYALGLRPDRDASSQAQLFYPRLAEDQNELALHFDLPDELPEDVIYEIQSCDDMKSWRTRIKRQDSNWTGDWAAKEMSSNARSFELPLPAEEPALYYRLLVSPR